MRFVSFTGAQGLGGAGVLRGDYVVDLSHRACQDLLGGAPSTMQALIEQGLLGWAQRLADTSFDADAMQPLTDVQLLAPLPRPGKVVGAAFNFTEIGRAHV